MRHGPVLALAAFTVFLAAPSLYAANPQTATEKKAIDYLLANQGKDGSWLPQAGPAVTALVVRGLVRAGHSPTEPGIQKGLNFIESTHQPDGGFYTDAHASYNTAIT